MDYCKTFIFCGNLIFGILAVKKKIAKIQVRQYYQDTDKKGNPDE